MLQDHPAIKDAALLREATYLDLDELLRMGRAFHAVTGAADIIPLDEPSLERTFINLIDNPLGVILVLQAETGLCGAVGAMLHPSYLNANHLTGQELFWWVDPEHRSGVGQSLFDALETWVQTQGADSFTMITLDALEPEKVGALYRRRGYRPAERSYLKGF